MPPITTSESIFDFRLAYEGSIVAHVPKNFFVAFLGTNQFRRVGLIFVCWFYDGNTQRLTESGFMDLSHVPMSRKIVSFFLS